MFVWVWGEESGWVWKNRSSSESTAFADTRETARNRVRFGNSSQCKFVQSVPAACIRQRRALSPTLGIAIELIGNGPPPRRGERDLHAQSGSIAHCAALAFAGRAPHAAAPR